MQFFHCQPAFYTSFQRPQISSGKDQCLAKFRQKGISSIKKTCLNTAFQRFSAHCLSFAPVIQAVLHFRVLKSLILWNCKTKLCVGSILRQRHCQQIQLHNTFSLLNHMLICYTCDSAYFLPCTLKTYMFPPLSSAVYFNIKSMCVFGGQHKSFIHSAVNLRRKQYWFRCSLIHLLGQF